MRRLLGFGLLAAGLLAASPSSALTLDPQFREKPHNLSQMAEFVNGPHTNSEVDPSLSADGRYLAVRQLNRFGDSTLLLYDLQPPRDTHPTGKLLLDFQKEYPSLLGQISRAFFSGESLYFEAQAKDPIKPNREIFRYDMSTKTLENLSLSAFTDDGQVTANGQNFAFVRSEKGEADIYVGDLRVRRKNLTWALNLKGPEKNLQDIKTREAMNPRYKVSLTNFPKEKRGQDKKIQRDPQITFFHEFLDGIGSASSLYYIEEDGGQDHIRRAFVDGDLRQSYDRPLSAPLTWEEERVSTRWTRPRLEQLVVRGSTIAFVEKEAGTPHVRAVDITSLVGYILRSPASTNPRLSSDGRLLAYELLRGHERLIQVIDLEKLDPDTGAHKAITLPHVPGSQDRWPTFFKEGDGVYRLIYSSTGPSTQRLQKEQATAKPVTQAVKKKEDSLKAFFMNLFRKKPAVAPVTEDTPKPRYEVLGVKIFLN